MTAGVKHDDDVNLTTGQEASPELSAQDTMTLRKINALTGAVLRSCSSPLPAGSSMYRLQEGEHGGNSAFFNRDGSDTRYGLSDGENGAMYAAVQPRTAMKEVFQKSKGMTESDLERYVMGNLVTERDSRLLQTSQLVMKTDVTLHELTTASRQVTQALATQAHAAGLNGIEFASNVTTETCYALWHDDPGGSCMVRTQYQVRLSEFEHQGRDAADILTFDLGIPVEE